MTIPYVGTSRLDLYNEVKRLESLQGVGEKSCDGGCLPRHLRHIPAWPWRLVLGGKHLEVNYCPKCGGKLDG